MCSLPIPRVEMLLPWLRMLNLFSINDLLPVHKPHVQLKLKKALKKTDVNFILPAKQSAASRGCCCQLNDLIKLSIVQN